MTHNFNTMKLQRYTSPHGYPLHTLGITFRTFLAVILMMMGSMGAWGQTTEIADKYITNVGTPSTTVSTAGWYLVYNSSNYLYDTGSTYSVGTGQPSNGVQVSSANAGYLIYVSGNYSGDSNETKATLMSGLGGFLVLGSDISRSTTSGTSLSNDQGKIYYHSGLTYRFLRINKGLTTTVLTNQAAKFSFAPVTLKYRYHVQVSGVSGGGVVIDGQNVSHDQYGYSTDKLTSGNVTAIIVDGYDPSVSVNGYTITVTYTPRVSPTSIDVTPTAKIIYAGDSYNLTTTFTPTNCYKKLTYTNYDSNIVSISSSGEVTGKTLGTTTITVNAYKVDGTTIADSKTVTVTVKDVCATPTITQNDNQITFNCSYPASGVTIYYTTDGSKPSSSNGIAVAAGATVTIHYGTTVKAIATASGFDDSGVVEYLVSDKPSGSGTQADPYIISTPSHLNDFQELVDGGKVNAYFKVTADFDAPSDYKTPSKTFTGTFNGDFHVISGLRNALFGTLAGATIKNITLDNVTISGGTDAGAIANTASSATRIYNCGVLATTGSSISGSRYVGSILGQLSGNTRVINCFSFANVSGGTWGAGIVGYNGSTSATQSNVGAQGMIMNCMFYGEITSGSSKAPVFGGNNISNAGSSALNTYNYYRYESGYSLNGNITAYNCALAAEERYLTRFEFYRNLLNSNRELAAWYATGSTTDASDVMAKWVLDKSIAPYPILKKQGIYPSIINIDAENAPTTSERSKGGKLGTLSVTISQGSGNPSGASITKSSLTLNITDKDEDNYNYNYYKVQLPYYNEVGTGNYTGNKVVTGWEITVSGGKNAFGTANYDAPNYNFADRNSTGKDNYATSGRIFAQGGYYNVPEGINSISIKPHWADCVYLSDPNYDVVYSTTYAATNVTTMGTRYTNGQNYTINGSSQKVYTSLANAFAQIKAGSSVYDKAIVLVGNYHLYGATWDYTIPVTVMSADLNMDNEPDYSFIYQHSDRKESTPVRFDFLNWPGIGMAQKVNETTQMPNQGIFQPKGWFEITNTCIVRFTEFEYDYGSKSAAPLILLGGIYEQFTSTQNANPTHTTYIHVGDNAWFKEFQNGTHADGTYQTPHNPISVTGGEYEKFYLSGTFKPDASAGAKTDNAECYVNGGKFGELAGAGQEQINGNVTFLVDNADIHEFYGGGINAKKPIAGDISVTIDNSYVDQYCGGPKFGNMSANKTVTTSATGSTFGKYFGAGYGGTSYNRVRTQNASNAATYAWGTWANDYGRSYSATNGGISTSYEYEYFAWAGGSSTSNVGRFYVNYASFSLAQTNDVWSTLNNCTVLQDYYGGGSLGKVNGNATSELNGCTIYGNAFGGGYSATIPSVAVMNKSGFQTAPSYNGQVGVYNPAVFPPSVEYTWSSKGSTTNPFTDDASGHWIYTNEDLTALGQVTGNTLITVTGDTYIQGLIDGEPNGGVFGGGDASAVKGTTTVNIQTTNANAIANVYGGANMADVGGATTVNVTSGTIGNVFGANNQSGTKAQSVVVNISQAADAPKTIINNVYGGGNLAAYTFTETPASPAVNMTSGTVNQNVFGGGLGVSAIVTGTPTVTIGGGNVNGSVYGGGALANVTGDTYVNLNGGEVGEDVFGGGKGELNDDGTAKTYADVSGDTHVTANGTTLKFPEDGIDQAVNHNIYGGGNLACRVNASNVTMNAGILPNDFFTSDPWQKSYDQVIAQNDNVVQGSVFGGGYGVFTAVNTTATVNVNVPTTAANKSILDVVGGGYNGYVLDKTDITIAGDVNIYKVYGGGLGSLGGYATAPDDKRSGAGINTFSMKETIGSVGEGKDGDGTNVTINGGHFYSNIYGGGAGLKSSTDPANEYLNVAEVFGKSHVTIDAIAGWKDEASAFSHSVYGGGALGLVNDEIMVKVMSGTMAGAEIFAGSLGEKGHLDKAKVTKGAAVHTLANGSDPAGALQGHFNIYGGCDMAQMVGNTDVDIKHGTFSGSIFGAGKGLYSEETSPGVWEEYLHYGKVTGNTTIVIDAPNVVLGVNNANDNDKIKIYGGGALGLVEGTINPVTLMSGELYGDVFGGSLGELGHPDKAKIVLTPGSYLGVLTTTSDTNKDGEGKPAPLKGNINIYGGCDMALVEGNTQVEITHGTFTGQMFGGGKGVATVFDNSVDIYADHGKVQGETKIIYNNDGTFNGNVYGGGALGSVIPATPPTDGKTTEIYLKKGVLNGHVFGGGYGENTNVDKAKVVGNTYITTREMDNPTDVLSGEMNHIYGGGDMAMVDGDTNLDFTRGKFNGEIFGGGHGIEEDADTQEGQEKYQNFGKVTGSTHVTIDGGQLGTNNNNDSEKIRIYGGGALGLVGGIDIVVKSGEHYGEVFGGSLGEYGHPRKAIVDGDSFVSTVANKLVDNNNPKVPADDASPLTGDIKFYGGCNQSQVTGDSKVEIYYGDFSGAIFGGGKGVSGSDEYGKIGGNASVLMMAGNTKAADVYGGCALGVVVGNTTVDLAGGEVKDVYGGGLGDAQTAAYVNGNATVTLNGSTVDGATNDCKVYGSIFGCNNVNGTPKGNAYVHIVKTEPRVGQVAFDPGHPEVSNSYAVAAVYGGGNNAAYIPDFTIDGVDGHTRVYVKDCENSIEYVYGGGNAAPVPATLVTIDGANSINYVFGGGNGKGDGNPGADVGYLGYYSKGSREEYGAGTATTVINGGTITNVYGGSNTLGYIRTKASVTVEQNSSCTLNVANIFAAGNEADMFCDGVINIGCIDQEMDQIFGGSNNANIKGNIMLNLTNGKFHQVFGGNNEGGCIEGTITVNIDETGCKPIEIDELYCCGNYAAYSVYGYDYDANGKGTPRTSGDRVAPTDPTLNIISFTRIGSIFGGGLGEAAAVYGNTNININPIPGKYAAAMATNTKYGVTNDNEGKSQSEQALPEAKWYTTNNCGIIGNVYGGGSEAMVYGNTNITIGSEAHNSHVTGGAELMAKTYDVGVNITGNIYGGGKKAKVTGDTNVKVGK